MLNLFIFYILLFQSHFLLALSNTPLKQSLFRLQVPSRHHPFTSKRQLHWPQSGQNGLVFQLNHHYRARPTLFFKVFLIGLIVERTILAMLKGDMVKILNILLYFVCILISIRVRQFHGASADDPNNINKFSQPFMQTMIAMDNFSRNHDLFYVLHQINALLQFMSEGYRKIEGNGTIRRPQDAEYINTYYLPQNRTIHNVPYYNRRKKQLKSNPSNDIIINLSERNERRDLKDQLQSIIKSNKNIDPYLSNYIKEISVEPVVNDNKFTNFNEELYPLREDQKVKVEEEMYFPLQNYYNYIYELELKKEIFRFVSDTKQKVAGVIQQNKPIMQKSQHSYQYDKDQHQDSIAEHKIIDKKVKGFYQTRFDPKGGKSKFEKHFPVEQLSPMHTNFTNNNYIKNEFFEVNENNRLQLSRKA